MTDDGKRTFTAGPLAISVDPNDSTIVATVTEPTTSATLSAPLTRNEVARFRMLLEGVWVYLLAIDDARVAADQLISHLTAIEDPAPKETTAPKTVRIDANPSA